MNKLILIIFSLLNCYVVSAQYGIVATGASIQNTNGKISNSVGQVAYKNTVNTGGSISEGLQQPLAVFTGINEKTEPAMLYKAYPNPSFDKVVVIINDNKSEPSEYTYVLLNTEGKQVDNGVLKEDFENKIEVKHLCQGSYQLIVYKNNLIIKSNQIIKN